jgi:3-oxoacyl-[acyl-carrier-protein] synthase-3
VVQVSNLQIAGIGAYLPGRVAATAAAATGSYQAERAATSGVAAATVSSELAAPEMAVRAARQALAMSGTHGADVRAVLHSYVNFSGARFWDAAPYIALHSAGSSVPGYDLLQSCNGGLAGIELARSLLVADGGSVLVTAADRFDTAGVDRWNADSNAVFGDGAGAIVLSSAPGGFARVAAMVTAADNRLEGESRGDRFDGRIGQPLDFEALRERYLRSSMSLREHLTAMEQVLTGALKQVLDDGGCTVDELAYLVPVVPTYPMLRGMLTHLIRIPEQRTTWSLGRTTGHVGAADHLIGLQHLFSTGAVGVGDRILLLGGGSGFTCTLVLVEVTGEFPG